MITFLLLFLWLLCKETMIQCLVQNINFQSFVKNKAFNEPLVMYC